MRTIVTINSNCNKTEKFFKEYASHLKDWKDPENKSELVDKLTTKVFSEVQPKIKGKKNLALINEKLKNCELLITFDENDMYFEVRIFYDHIQTLKRLTSVVLKSIQNDIQKQKHIFEPTQIIIAEIQLDNVLLEGMYYNNRLALLKKIIFKDKKIETIFVFVVFLFTVISLWYVWVNFKNNDDTIWYELGSKSLAPFATSTILTVINIWSYAILTYKNTNIVWVE